jgi:uncharacterized membrane protein YbhN (UPF0104 family)
LAQPTPDADIFPPETIRRIVPFVIFAAVAYVGAFLLTDAKALAAQLGRISIDYVIVALLLASTSFVVRAARWHYYLRISNLSVPVRDSLLIFLVGLLMSLTPGKVGEIVKALLLKQGWQIPVAKSAPIVLAERITDVIAVLILGGAGLLTIPHGRAGGIAALMGAAGLVSLCAVRRVGFWVIGMTSRLPWLSRRREKITIAYSALAGVQEAVPLSVAIALACLAWGLQSLCILVIARAFPTIHVTLGASIVACCVPLVAGALALVPGGLGATEASMTGLLLSLGTAVSLSQAIAITICFRLVTFWLAVVLGLIALGIWRLRRAAGSAQPGLTP